MQDRYAGDLGDFLKFGLLRWLAPPEAAWPRLGVIWYRTADEAHNANGKHIAYLTPGHRSAGPLRQLDPDLYDRLARVVSTGQRSTAALTTVGVLGAQTRFFGDLLDLADLPANTRDARQARRQSWAQRALAATADCDMIFADPDNGIRPTWHLALWVRLSHSPSACVNPVGAVGLEPTNPSLVSKVFSLAGGRWVLPVVASSCGDRGW